VIATRDAYTRTTYVSQDPCSRHLFGPLFQLKTPLYDLVQLTSSSTSVVSLGVLDVEHDLSLGLRLLSFRRLLPSRRAARLPGLPRERRALRRRQLCDPGLLEGSDSRPIGAIEHMNMAVAERS